MNLSPGGNLLELYGLGRTISVRAEVVNNNNNYLLGRLNHHRDGDYIIVRSVIRSVEQYGAYCCVRSVEP